MLSDEARCLSRKEPDLFKAATREFKGDYNPFHPSVIGSEAFNRKLMILLNLRFLFTELPKEARLEDMANLLNLDLKNLDVKQLGIDAIKDQHRINQQLSSNQCAILPEDTAQIMLTGVSIPPVIKHPNAHLSDQFPNTHLSASVSYCTPFYSGNTNAAILQLTRTSSP